MFHSHQVVKSVMEHVPGTGRWYLIDRGRITVFLVLLLLFPICLAGGVNETASFSSAELFAPVQQHVHGSTIVELPDGDLLVAWFQGTGERTADDVAILGARLEKGQDRWSEPFLLADSPGFPDINPVLFMDMRGRLWLVWYTVLAHQWDTSLLKYRISEDFEDGVPVWDWQDVLLVKPGDPPGYGIQEDDRFAASVSRQLDDYERYLEQLPGASERRQEWNDWKAAVLGNVRGQNFVRRGSRIDEDGVKTEHSVGYPYYRRMGWQTRNKPFVLDGRTLILPLYSDGLDFSLMALTDDLGANWYFSSPLVGLANIQASIVQKRNGNLVAYMRDNGPPPKRLQVSESDDGGLTWSNVRDSTLPNPGAGADFVTLKNGHWVAVYNDSERGRQSLAVSLSLDEGESWSHTQHIERDPRDSDVALRSHYPAVIQGADGFLYVSYSYHGNDSKGEPSKTIKWARFNEAWISQ
ncbi:MAG: exo-alpha-sialidase [Acidobacteriota bacterium]|nr:MAG: exo-alpha-sialidase [Acidobacteriota bacterium]